MFRSSISVFKLTLAVMLLAELFVPAEALALPVFARQYKVPCSSCHSAIPRRNEYGDAFFKNGYQWPGESGTTQTGTIDDATKMRGVALYEGLLQSDLGLGLLIGMSGSYLDDPQVLESFQLGQPSLKLVTGGKLGSSFSYYGTWSGGSSFNEVTLNWNQIFGNRLLNARIGKFEQQTTLFKSNETLLGQYIHGTRAMTGHSVTKSRLGGELYGLVGQRFHWALGVVRNSGGSSKTDAYYQLSYKFGGATFDGEEPDISLDEPSVWEDMHFTLAHWGYLGKVDDIDGTVTADIRRLGLDFKYHWNAFSLWGGGVLGLDRDRTLDADHTHLTGFLEVSYAVYSWLIPMYLVQAQDASSMDRLYMQHEAGVVILVQENMRLKAKYTYTDDLTQNERAEVQLLFGM